MRAKKRRKVRRDNLTSIAERLGVSRNVVSFTLKQHGGRSAINRALKAMLK